MGGQFGGGVALSFVVVLRTVGNSVNFLLVECRLVFVFSPFFRHPIPISFQVLLFFV